MKTKNQIPRSLVGLVQLGVKALAGAQVNGVEISLEHNSATRIATDLYDVTGDPATPEVPGKQAILNSRKAALTTARENARLARKTGRDYCRQAIALLKPILGTQHNSAWNAAGFLTPSLAVPADPMTMLIEFRQYFVAHPAHENAPSLLTAARANTLQSALQTANHAAGAADADRIDAKTARDAALRQLGERLSDLRSELELVLEDDDGRWYEFGFQRPVDGRMPAPVEELELATSGPGAISGTWALSALADNYRVSWRLAGSAAEPTEVGLFTDRQCLISSLPTGQQVVVMVSARNNAGETAPTEAAILVS